MVTLTVKTTDGDTYTEKLFISVYTRIGSYTGVVNKDTDAYMGASVDSQEQRHGMFCDCVG